MALIRDMPFDQRKSGGICRARRPTNQVGKTAIVLQLHTRTGAKT